MVLPKTTVHLSRLAGNALKTFTHGFSQTVVAASQSTFNNSQNTPSAPLAGSFTRRLHSTTPKPGSHDPSDTAAPATLPSLILNNFHIKSAFAKDVASNQQDLLRKNKKQDADHKLASPVPNRIGWNSPLPNPTPLASSSQSPNYTDESFSDTRPAGRDVLRRSYSTSAVDDFAKGIDDEAAEAVAHAQLDHAIKALPQALDLGPDDQSLPASPASPASAKVRQSLDSASDRSTPATVTSALSRLSSATVLSTPRARDSIDHDSKPYDSSICTAPDQQYERLVAAIRLQPIIHENAPQALQIYSDMLQERRAPSTDFVNLLLRVLSARALYVANTLTELRRNNERFVLPYVGQTSVLQGNPSGRVVSADDQSLDLALQILKKYPTPRISETSYEDLIQACASQGRTLELTKLYHDLELISNPISRIFPSIINAFSAVGDLDSVVTYYNKYKALAIANDQGRNQFERIDNQVYAAVIKAYGDCDRLDAGKRFLGRIHASEPDHVKKDQLSDMTWLHAFIPLALERNNSELLQHWSNNITAVNLETATSLFVTRAADLGDVAASTSAYNALLKMQGGLLQPSIAMLAMHLRLGDIAAATPYWAVVETAPASVQTFKPTMMWILNLIKVGRTAQAIQEAQYMFTKIRSSGHPAAEIKPCLDEGIHILVKSLNEIPITNSDHIMAVILRLMYDNGELHWAIAGSALANLGPSSISSLSNDDLATFTKAQSHLIADGSVNDGAAPARFACLLNNIVSRNVLPDVATESVIESALHSLDRIDLGLLWTNYRYPQPPSPGTAVQSVKSATQNTSNAEYDPYSNCTDNRGSVLITDLLDSARGKSGTHLDQALWKFRNMRRAGRYPRYFTYSKLITAAAKENRFDTAMDILEKVRCDLPLLPQYRVVRYGWTGILDSILAACLTCGHREMANEFHQELLSIGSSPSANTYGHYIATLKDNSNVSDEASEAVAIFTRAKAEGVVPTSFLYNALIGKLGKARRIDDCLFYLAEMRSLDIRPTSVTYGTFVNALCRVSDEKFAEEMFEEMENSPNYKPRPAPYHSLMQHFLGTKHDKAKVLSYAERMKSSGIQPTMHTFKLLIDAHARLEPIDMGAAEAVLEDMRASGIRPEAVHYASLLHARGCVLHDMDGVWKLWRDLIGDSRVNDQPCIYQALCEALVANDQIAQLDKVVDELQRRNIGMTPYIANALIRGWTVGKDLDKARRAYGLVSGREREPSTYEAMVKACMVLGDESGAREVAGEAMGRGYPPAVVGKITDLARCNEEVL